MTIVQKQAHFQEQYHELFAYVYKYITFRIQDIADAEDVVSIVLISAFEKIKQWDPIRGSLKQWVSGVMKFKLVDYWRKHKVILELDEALDLSTKSSTIKLDDQIDNQIIFAEAMNQLPKNIRLLFLMHYVDDLSYAEIARCTNKTEPAIRKLFSRTHQFIREYFANKYSVSTNV